MSVTISEAVKYIGVDDKTIDLFESQYVVPHGVSYNSYLILDEKVALMDTVELADGYSQLTVNVRKIFVFLDSSDVAFPSRKCLEYWFCFLKKMCCFSLPFLPLAICWMHY